MTIRQTHMSKLFSRIVPESSQNQIPLFAKKYKEKTFKSASADIYNDMVFQHFGLNNLTQVFSKYLIPSVQH